MKDASIQYSTTVAKGTSYKERKFIVFNITGNFGAYSLSSIISGVGTISNIATDTLTNSYVILLRWNFDTAFDDTDYGITGWVTNTASNESWAVGTNTNDSTTYTNVCLSYVESNSEPDVVANSGIIVHLEAFTF